MWREIGSLDTTCGPEDFISGLEVWVKRPQVVNRRLLGAALVKGDWDDVGGGSESVRTPYELRERVFLRELLPRAKSVEPRKETVTICHGERDLVLFGIFTVLKLSILHSMTVLMVSECRFSSGVGDL